MRRLIIPLIIMLALVTAAQTALANSPLPTGMVTVEHLNVRSAPSVTSVLLTRIDLRATYPVIGRTADGKWWQLQLDENTVGWVTAEYGYLSVIHPQDVPVTAESGAALALRGSEGRITGLLVSVRAEPGTGRVIDSLGRGTSVRVIGRTEASDWWEIQLDETGSVGWIPATALSVTNRAGVPVVA